MEREDFQKGLRVVFHPTSGLWYEGALQERNGDYATVMVDTAKNTYAGMVWHWDPSREFRGINLERIKILPNQPVQVSTPKLGPLRRLFNRR